MIQCISVFALKNVKSFLCVFAALSNVANHRHVYWFLKCMGQSEVFKVESTRCFKLKLAFFPRSFNLHSSLFSLWQMYWSLIVSYTLKIWKQMRCYFCWQTMSPKSPIHFNHVCNTSIDVLISWNAKGTGKMNDLHCERAFCSFQQFNIPENIFPITSRFLILYVKSSPSFLFCLPALILIIYWRILQDGKALYQHSSYSFFI